MIDHLSALRAIAAHRAEAVVIATMSAAFAWPKVSAHPHLDLMHSDAMGKVSSLGLGLALALPNRRIIVLDGDGSLLMNLGSLVTIAHMAPPNLVHVVLGNDMYLTSGSQPIPNAGRIDFAGFAASAGYAHAHRFEERDGLERGLADVMTEAGPVFVYLKVAPAWRPSRFLSATTRIRISRVRAAIRQARRRIQTAAAGPVAPADDHVLAAGFRRLGSRGEPFRR